MPEKVKKKQVKLTIIPFFFFFVTYASQTDLFAFEILGGYLYLHMDLGEGALKVRASEARVDDGTWHDVALRRVEREGHVVVDGAILDFRPPGNDLTILTVQAVFFL